MTFSVLQVYDVLWLTYQILTFLMLSDSIYIYNILMYQLPLNFYATIFFMQLWHTELQAIQYSIFFDNNLSTLLFRKGQVPQSNHRS